ncbi:hypothetical protein ZIOFF_047765 [Zingiber officinale]|uniref:Uncharacterized protein n=1 Tax=Zingiber officinale TaxID=94328 RepID=A0A8J5KW17_ZINOF|nr:hypothetical protein ZIOFF_047765 [Zingiber officinale]
MELINPPSSSAAAVNLFFRLPGAALVLRRGVSSSAFTTVLSLFRVNLLLGRRNKIDLPVAWWFVFSHASQMDGQGASARGASDVKTFAYGSDLFPYQVRSMNQILESNIWKGREGGFRDWKDNAISWRTSTSS